ncbi:MutS-related protein [Flavitalea flava]
MSFIADKQTLEDLNLLSKYKPDSVYNLFRGVHTGGGERLLEKMFRSPLSDPDAINRRNAVFSYFQKKALAFPLNSKLFDVMENYLDTDGDSNILSAIINTSWKRLLGAIVRDETYSTIQTGVLACIELLNTWYDFLTRLGDEENNDPLKEEKNALRKIFNDPRMAWLPKQRGLQQLSMLKTIKVDHLLRTVLQEEMTTVLEIIYHFDVYITVGRAAAAHGFTYAYALPQNRNVFRALGLRHPCLKNAVGNSINLHRDGNLLFLTGANMAGKSTFMKSFGIAVYLAHMGFPVAATEMEFSIKNGLYSSINVPDNLNLGYSHFYAEVLRVKKVAEEVGRSQNMVVIFDELFKGTNVKDAYDATLAITHAFAAYTNCFFIVSTHITEVGEVLAERCDSLQLAYLPTILDGLVPRYTYKLEKGISADRHGMMIIENEQIVQIIESTNT